MYCCKIMNMEMQSLPGSTQFARTYQSGNLDLLLLVGSNVKVRSMQRSETEAIRTQIEPSK